MTSTSEQGARRVGPYTVVHSEPKYENIRLKIREDRVEDRRGEETVFAVIAAKPTVTVLPIDDDNEVHLVREFKYAIGEPSLEAINGTIEAGETPEQAGLREIAEEAGLIAAEWVDMGIINSLTSIVDSPSHTFLARKLSTIRRSAAPDQALEVVKASFADALKWVLDGTITHGASCALILKTHILLERASRR